MKIAIVGVRGIPNNYGGMETLAEHLAEFLSQKNDVQIYCSSYDMDSRLETYLGAKLIYIPITSHGGFGILYDSLALLHAALTCDKILLLGVGGGFMLSLLGKKRKDTVVNIGGLDWKRDKWSKFAQKVILKSEQLLVKNGGQIVADNIGIKDYVYLTYRRNAHFIAFGGDQVMCQPITAEALKRYPFLGSPYAFIVTRIQKDNNIEMMLEAFSDNPPMPFVIIGNWEATSYGRKLKAIYQKVKSIHLINPIYDTYELDLLRSNCKIYVHGHSVGGTNPTLVEAMSLGLPILAFANGFNEYSTFQKAKYFKNREELKQLVAQHEGLNLQGVGMDMLDLARTHYRWEKVTSDYEQVIRGEPQRVDRV
ncbi:DUF1972 domain-containing protein [Algoriphagus jejuensis]|uniref:DUF1972 domain-containing protein n=1 Tax=Algoriphagus jejuensis TaxID=419934 RepID=A0ABN1N1E3_9BACT